MSIYVFDFLYRLCYYENMAEEKQTVQPEIIDDTLTADDMSALREVLQDEHSRGMTPVSVYKQDEIIHDDFEQ